MRERSELIGAIGACESCYLKLGGPLNEIYEDVMNEGEGSLVDSGK